MKKPPIQSLMPNGVVAKWRFRTWKHHEEIGMEAEPIEDFLNQCSKDGYQTIVIEAFETRTTIWASKVSE
jgi:hypothetical protein